jgi:dUTP pyrophosphatase
MIMYPPLKVKKLFPDAVLPTRANPTDSGLDVCAYRFEKFYAEDAFLDKVMQPMPDGSQGYAQAVALRTNDRILINTGLAITVDAGYEVQVRPRSGNALKRGLIVVNSPGTIDYTYRGPVCVIIANIGHETQKLVIGEKIAQLVVCPVILSEVKEVPELDDTARGAGGFGSTGK